MADQIIKSCVRGLDLLKLLNTHNYVSAPQLSKLAGLPRPTVYRILETLVKAGYVARDEATDVFYVTGDVISLSRGYGLSELAIQLAKPRVQEYSQAICWPCLLHQRVGDKMVVRAIIRSPRAFSYPKIGKEHPLLTSAPGRAFLSSLPEQDRKAWVAELLLGSTTPGPSASEMSSLLRDAVLLGCGFREDGMVPRTCGLSLPIRIRGIHAAYWSIFLMNSAYTVRRAIDTYLSSAQQVVASIEADLERTGGQLAPMAAALHPGPGSPDGSRLAGGVQAARTR